MKKQISDRIISLGEYVASTFFHPGTNLFYDYVSAGDPEHRFDHLPKKDEIEHLVPEPCGRGTGMEDAPLHAGCMLDLLCRTGNFEFAGKVFDGLYGITMRHDTPGFAARGFSPFAGTLCYPNSSRDQFTLAVFGGWRAARMLKGSEEQAAELLGAVSDYCFRNVTRENGWNLMRRDGKKAMVSIMKGPGCAPHEVLRLPMIHAAAGVIRGERKRIDAAAELLPEAVAHTMTMDMDKNWWDFPLVQLQLSVVLLQECGVFSGWTEQFDEIRRAVGILAHRSLKDLLVKARRGVRFDAPAPDWRKCERRLVTVPEDEGGIVYRHVVFPKEYHEETEILRGVGNLLTAVFYAGGTPDGTEEEMLEDLLQMIPLKECRSGGLTELLAGLGLIYETALRIGEHTESRRAAGKEGA